MVLFLLLLSCESSVSVKENPDRKKKLKMGFSGLSQIITNLINFFLFSKLMFEK